MSSVDHPAHYVDGEYECIEVMKSIYGTDFKVPGSVCALLPGTE